MCVICVCDIFLRIRRSQRYTFKEVSAVTVAYKRQVGGFRDWRAGEDLDFMERLALSPPRILKAPLAETVWDLAVDRQRVFQKWRSYEYHNAVQGNSWHRPVFLWNSLGGALAAIATVVIGLPGTLFPVSYNPPSTSTAAHGQV